MKTTAGRSCVQVGRVVIGNVNFANNQETSEGVCCRAHSRLLHSQPAGSMRVQAQRSNNETYGDLPFEYDL